MSEDKWYMDIDMAETSKNRIREIELLTSRINMLQEHYKYNNKDKNTYMEIMRLSKNRMKILNYLKKRNTTIYNLLIIKLSNSSTE